MTGQGIAPLMPTAGAPLRRSMRSALDYVHDAGASPPSAGSDAADGGHPDTLPRPVCFEYPWGDALSLLRRETPDLCLANLEACITARGTPASPQIHARLSPQQLPVLAALGVQGVVLAGPHALDWGPHGLHDTLQCLRQAGIRGVGAGHDSIEAAEEAQWPLPGRGRLRLLAFGHASCGLAATAAAAERRPGINWLRDLDARAVAGIAARVGAQRREGDIVVVSLHWGAQWGYEVTREQRDFAQALVDVAGVDLVWGQASRHPRPIEVHHGRLILYGVGTFLKDAGLAAGHEQLRPELAALYLPRLATDGRLLDLRLWPLRVHLFRLKRACASEAQWLARALGAACRRHGTALAPRGDGSLRLDW
jgi:poly-gamma-glutamate synthesis protein (capsule biosynthesis protein)